jgi:hypothetical protein
MELVEGPTLADRIAEGAIPVDTALVIAKQIAEALEAAHDQGIIHRDLKPANIKVRTDGTVKVLDFGLARTVEPAGSGANVSQSPTSTSPAVTAAGVILGTAAYMSPEQARGMPLDKRSDIWAFGCVLYEMLTGRRGFGGDSVPDTIAAILQREPDFAALPPAAKPFAGILRRCLEKDVTRRLRDIGDVRQWLEETAGQAPAAPTSLALKSRRAWWIAAVLVAFVLGGTIAGLYPQSRGLTVTPIVSRFELESPQPDALTAESFGTTSPFPRTARALFIQRRAMAFLSLSVAAWIAWTLIRCLGRKEPGSRFSLPTDNRSVLRRSTRSSTCRQKVGRASLSAKQRPDSAARVGDPTERLSSRRMAESAYFVCLPPAANRRSWLLLIRHVVKTTMCSPASFLVTRP